MLPYSFITNAPAKVPKGIIAEIMLSFIVSTLPNIFTGTVDWTSDINKIFIKLIKALQKNIEMQHKTKILFIVIAVISLNIPDDIKHIATVFLRFAFSIFLNCVNAPPTIDPIALIDSISP